MKSDTQEHLIDVVVLFVAIQIALFSWDRIGWWGLVGVMVASVVITVCTILVVAFLRGSHDEE